jgi:hypothetical protein
MGRTAFGVEEMLVCTCVEMQFARFWVVSLRHDDDDDDSHKMSRVKK